MGTDLQTPLAALPSLLPMLGQKASCCGYLGSSMMTAALLPDVAAKRRSPCFWKNHYASHATAGPGVVDISAPARLPCMLMCLADLPLIHDCSPQRVFVHLSYF
ncbi:hypothetical protein EJ02DRAFT_130923 [Clathrospora elynae]|uniref:Uncharacterized protein n=1 Tax=Clathrospora elynae TaxID=706981 RepID=A0A6A5T3A8_9PLEO|nr:hypothetical protein EJ02DRAFT_130923 [Clathrospora elynae]